MPGELELDVRVKNLEKATKEMKRKFKEAGIQLEDSLSRGAEKGLSRIEKQFSKLATAIGSGLIVRGFQRIAGGILTLAGNLEQAQISFETMLGSAQKAQVTLTDLSKFAQKTPFELTGIRQNAKQLLAVGVDAKNLIPTLKSLGDVSAGLNVPLERLILNYGQVISQGKLTGRELRDFAIAGVPILEELANMLGTTRAKIQELVASSDITSDIVVKAFERMTGEGGRFADLMDKQSTTLQGSLSNLRDAFDTLAEVVGLFFIPALTKAVQAVIPIIENIRERARENPKLVKGIGVAIATLTALVGILGVIGPILGLLTLGFGSMLGPVAAIAAGIAGLAGGFAFFSTQTREATDVAGKARDKIRELEKEQKKLRKELKKGKIERTEYNGRMKDNEELQRQNQELVDGSTQSMGDLQLQMKGLNDQNLNLETQAFKDQRAEIIANINALRAYKAELLSVKVQEYEETRRAFDVQQTTGVGVGGLQAGIGSPLGGINNQKVLSQTEQSLNDLSLDIANLSKEVDTLNYYSTDFNTAMGEVAETITDTGGAVDDFNDSTGGSGGAVDNLKDLKEQIDDTGDKAQDVIAKFGDLKDASEELTSKMKDNFRELDLQIRDTTDSLTSLESAFNKDIANIEGGRDDNLENNQRQFIRSQLQIIENAKAKLDELKSEGFVLGDDVEEQEAIIKAAEQALSDRELINENILAQERERLELSEQELQPQDFITKQKEEQAKADEVIAERTAQFEEQQRKLQETLRILQFFKDFDFENSDQLQSLLDSPELSGLSVEGQTLVQKLAKDRIELEKQKEAKLELERELQGELISLNNQYASIARNNIQALGSEYQNIINLIQRAINLQSTLNAGVGIQGRATGGPVNAGQPYLVGENPDGSMNDTTELFIPKQAGSIANAQQVQQAMKDVMAQQISNDNSKKVEVGSVHYETQGDFETFLEKVLFKL